MRTDTDLTRLARHPLLSSIPERKLAQLVTLFDFVELPAGRVLMREDGAGDETFLIEHGDVLVEIAGEVIATLGAGEVVGEMAVLERKRRTATVTALTDVTAIVIAPRAFWSLVAADTSVGLKVATTIAARLRQLESVR